MKAVRLRSVSISECPFDERCRVDVSKNQPRLRAKREAQLDEFPKLRTHGFTGCHLQSGNTVVLFPRPDGIAWVAIWQSCLAKDRVLEKHALQLNSPEWPLLSAVVDGA